ncbi:MAG: glycosyltransferase family 87 protein [Candidatus Zixiibacteriota bacterium]
MFIILLVLVFIFLFKMRYHENIITLDFRSFYFGSRVLMDGDNIYEQDNLKKKAEEVGIDDGVYPYLYTPHTAFYLIPIASLSPNWAHKSWLLIMILMTLLLYALLLKITLKSLDDKTIKAHTSFILITLLFFAIQAFASNIRCGQINILVLASIVASIYLSLSEKNQIWAGLALAPAILIKTTPLGLLVYFLLNKQFKVIIGAIIGIITLTIPLLFFQNSLNAIHDFIEFSRFLGYGSQIPDLFDISVATNCSINGFWARFGFAEGRIRFMTYLSFIVLAIPLVFCHLKYRKREVYKLLLLPYLIFMTIGSPVTYVTHTIFIFPGLLLWAKHLIDKGSWKKIIITLVLAMLVSASWPFKYNHYGINYFLFRSLNLYFLLIIYILSLVSIFRECAMTHCNTSKLKHP